MKKRILAVVLAAALLCILAAGCKKQVGTPEDNAMPKEESSEDEEQESYKFGFSGITMENPYYITLESAIREELEAGGHTLITKDPALDSDTQVAQIDEMIEEGIQAIFLSPVDWDAITPTLEKLKESDVRIINVDTEVKESNLVDAYIGSDNKKAGQICGERLVEKHPDGGKVIILECPTMNSINDRITGFEEAISEKGFEVVARADVKGDLKSALAFAKQFLEENDEITAIMCGNDQIALGALVAAQSLDRKNVEIYGIDGSPDLKKELEKSSTLIAGTCAQSPIHIGKEAADIAVSMMNGDDYEETTYEDVFFIDRENVSMYGTDGWQ